MWSWFRVSKIVTSAFSPPEDRNTAYAHIQKEIQALEAAIRALKGRHNSLSSISRLPPELLSRIFEFLARGKCYAEKRKLHWIGISYVCSQWRHIALGCPRLWSDIQCSFSPRLAMEMLKHLKTVPITVEGRAGWGSYISAGNNAVTAALEQLGRIENLTLTLCGSPKLKEIVSSLSGAAPLLHTFQITLDDSQAMLPENIFSPGGAPQLCCLSLNGCTVNWRSGFLCSLTHLMVARAPTGCRLSVNKLITNLGNMPQLESIHLSSVMAPSGQSELNTSFSPSTLLPFIACIHLGDNLMNCLAFFTQLTYSNTAIVSVKCLNSHAAYHTDNIAPSVRDLITTIDSKNIVPITFLYIENQDFYHVTFRGHDLQGTKQIFVEFQDVSFQPSSISWNSLAIHHLKSLQVGIKIPQSVWLSIFGKLKKLKTIVITDHANEFLHALSHGILISWGSALPWTVTSSPGKLRFDALKSLSLSSTLGEHYGQWPWTKTLALCFRERWRWGLTLWRLCIEGYNDGVDVVRQLGAFIKHIKWTEVCDKETSISDEELQRLLLWLSARRSNQWIRVIDCMACIAVRSGSIHSLRSTWTGYHINIISKNCIDRARVPVMRYRHHVGGQDSRSNIGIRGLMGVW